eukprot:scaffold22158_cov73-Phaeocystis_antarctica.AAC.2
MASTLAKSRLIPWLSLVLFGACARKLVRPLMKLLALRDVHPNMTHEGHGHERTACTGCSPGE